MLHDIESAFEDADILIYMHDLTDKRDDNQLIDIVAKYSQPKIVVLNKADLVDEKHFQLKEKNLKKNSLM